MSNMIELKCRSSPTTGENKISLAYDDCIENGLSMGSLVFVVGGKTTVAQVTISDEAVPGEILMGATMRLNADVNDGDVASIRQLEAEVLQRVRFQPCEAGIDDGLLQQAARQLRDVYVTQNARFLVQVNGEAVELCATKVKPGHGWLVNETQIDVKNRVASRLGPNVPNVSFADIGGLDSTIEEVKEIAIVPLIHPEVYQRAGQDPPKGILMFGPPGVGKTLLAKALAREAQCNFFNINGPELFSAAYGESEKRLREIFARARKEAPSVIYIDEIDAIAGSRKDGKGQLEKRILTQLLTELDGFDDRGQILVVGSTNMLESIDDALLRAGRFDRRIKIPYPDPAGREQILSIHSAGMPLEPGFSLEAWAKKTPGFTGADLANLCRHAAVTAMNRVFGVERLMAPEELREEELETLEVGDLDFEQGKERALPHHVESHRPANMGFHDMDDIVGHDVAKDELNEHLVLPILHKEIYESMGLNCNGGVILHGPPGTGKTMLGKAAASLSGVQFMAVSGPELLSKWVGESERAVRELFQRAQDAAPVVLFFDEFDALGRQRDGGESSSHSNSVVAQLLSLMDGLGSTKDIYLMASTNQIDLVDKAFLRPGRFERAIYVPPLEKRQFFEFFTRQTKGKPCLVSNQQWQAFIARLVDEATGADLQGLLNTAKRNAVSRAIALKQPNPALEERDLILALNGYPHLFAGYAPREPEQDDWNDDDDDDWVIP